MLDGTSYQVVRQLGAGGMGVVYEIEHVRLKKRYVAKVMHESIKNDASALKRMEREAQVLASLTHPNVVQVHDFGTTRDGVHYFVMEKLEGVDLRAFMAKPVPRVRALGIVADVLDALDYVHRRGIVHRDIKPENVFLAELPVGTVTKVLDFGIAHIFDADGRLSHARITRTGGFTGTLYYAAPEQMQGKQTGPPTDVYAAGLVLFELLAGKGPFHDDPGVGLSRCFRPAPRLTEVVRIPGEVSDAVARALEQDPAARPAAGALAAELRKLATLPSLESPADGDEPSSPDVDELLRAMPVHRSTPPTGALPASVVGPATVAPATPVRQGSPSRHANVEPTVASPSVPPVVSTPVVQLQPTPFPAGSSPGMAPFAHPSTPRAPGRGETSPGVYATVDSVPNAVPRAKPAWVSFAAVGAAAVVAIALFGGALLYKRAATTASATTPAAATPAAESASASSPPVPSSEPGTPVESATTSQSAASPPAAATSSAPPFLSPPPRSQPAPPPTSISKAQPAPTQARPAASASAAHGGYFREL
jgi:serine/threonine-protein kinase